ncbi:MAG: GNAT family N-acetyltransferase [Bacillota bacterium]
MFCATWEFGTEAFESVRMIRTRVFLEELGLPEKEVFDRADAIAVHLLVRSGEGEPFAAARIWPDGADTRIGLIAVLPQFRRQQLGELCLRMLLYKAQQLPGERILLRARRGTEGFYRRFGFLPIDVQSDGSGSVELFVRRDEVFWPDRCAPCAP